MDDVEKLDVIQDDFIHYQILMFWQDTRLQYINSHILLGDVWPDLVTNLVVPPDVRPSGGVGLTSDAWRQPLVRPDVRPFFFEKKIFSIFF